MRDTYEHHNTRFLARMLGWFSIGLGVIELIIPRILKRRTGAVGSPAILQGYGLREIGTGVAILAARRPAYWVWARVAGDVLDFVTLLPVLRGSNPRHVGGAAALAFVALATAADIYVASRAQRRG